MITTNDLLQYEFGPEENYSTICDATKMLFMSDMSRAQLVKPAAFKPDTYIGIIRQEPLIYSVFYAQQFQTHQEYLDWYSALI
jgi:hypothetical protein